MLFLHKGLFVLIPYLLLTYGPKPQGSVEKHPAAKQQIANLRSLFSERESQHNLACVFDHSRRYASLPDLPILRQALEFAEEKGKTVLIDDFRRLFAHYAGSDRSAFLLELLEFKNSIRDMRTTRLLGMLSERQLAHLSFSEGPIRYARVPTPRTKLSPLERQQQTRFAIRASKRARSNAADAKARELSTLKDELTKTNEKFTYKRLAEVANEKGFRTTHYKPWTAAAVSRALKRLEESEVRDQAPAEKATPKNGGSI